MDSLKAAIQSSLTKFNEDVVRRSGASVKAHLRLMIKANVSDFENLSVHYVFNILQKSYVKAFFHLPSGIIFIKVFRWVNLSWPPCTYSSMHHKSLVLTHCQFHVFLLHSKMKQHPKHWTILQPQWSHYSAQHPPRAHFLLFHSYNTGQQMKKRSNNSYLICFYKLYCTRFWSPFLREIESFCKSCFEVPKIIKLCIFKI